MWTAVLIRSFYCFYNSFKIYANLNMIFLKFSIKVLAELQWKINIFVFKSRELVINYTLINYLNYKYLHKNEITIFFNSQKSTQQYGLKSVHLDVYLSYRHRRWNNSFKDTLSNISIQGTIGIVKTVHPIVCTTM